MSIPILNKLKWRLFTFLCCFVFTSNGQSIIPKFSHVDVNNGLSQGNVTCIMQDSQGFMWFGTWDGLNMYDGFRVKVFREQLKKTNSIKGSLINSLLELSPTEIAIATSHCLNIYNRKTEQFVSYNINNKPNDTKIVKLNKQTLVLCINNELWNFNLNTQQFSKEDTYKAVLWNEYFGKNKIAVNHSEALYTNLFEVILKDTSLFKKIQNVHEQYLINDLVFFKSKYYIATDQGLFALNYNHLELLTKPIKIKSLAQQKSILYIGTQEFGIMLYDMTKAKINETWQYDERNPHSLAGNFIRTMFVSQDHVIWVSSLGSGLSYADMKDKVVKTIFTKYDARLLMKQDAYIKNLLEDKDSLLWVNTVTGNIYILNSAYEIVHVIKPEQIDAIRKPNSCQQIYQSRTNDIYLLTEKGLYKKQQNYSFVRIDSKNYMFNQDYFIHMNALNDSSFLIGSRQGISMLILNERKLYLKRDFRFDTSNVILSTYTDTKGHVYINRMFSGIEIYNYSKNKYQKIKSLAFGFNAKHYLEVGDTLWIATSLGIMKLNTNDFTFNIIDESDGLPSQCVYSLQKDPLNHAAFWCSSNKGIYRLNTQTNEINSLGLEDGLSSLEFNTNSFATRKCCDLVFGSTNGLAIIHNTNLDRLAKEKDILLVDISNGGKLMFPEIQDGIQLYSILYQNNGFAARLIKLKFPNFGSKIRYRLKGYDKNSIENVYPVELRYSNLPIGTYELEVESINDKGQPQWIELAKLKVIAPWYLSIWAFLFYTLVVIMICWWILNLYHKKNVQEKMALQQANEIILKERDRISADLHDDIGSTLSSILIYNELILANGSTKPKVIQSLSEKIAIQVKELMMRTEDIIWSLKIKEHHLETIAKRVSEYAKELFSIQGITHTIEIDSEIEALIQKPEHRRNILMIIKEAMNNCRKYSQASEVAIQMVKNGKEILLVIKDNGIGFDEAKVNFGDGIQNIKNRCSSMSGTATITSKLGKGTTINCSFPIARFSQKT